MVTLKDIAEQVGVSIRTVTRALSGTGYVRADLRAEILAIAERFGYRPDPVAQSLRLGRTRQIVVVSYSVDELHMAKIASLEEHVRPAGYIVSVLMAPRTSLGSASLVDEITARKPAGVAVVGALDLDLTPLAETLYRAGIPCVPIDARSAYPAVGIDRSAGVEEATRYLLSRGRRRIVYLGPEGSASRIDGFRRALDGGDVEPRFFDPGSGRAASTLASGLLALHPDVDAVQAYSDEWALELLAGLHDRGVRVPGDVAVVGFDDRWAASYSWPALTTVAQPGERIGEAVAGLLTGSGRIRLESLMRPTPDHDLVARLAREMSQRIPTELIVRASA